MTADRITELVAVGESETLEFKSTTGQRTNAAKTLCAMLNQRGGIVLFGVTPEGLVSGQQVSEDTIEKVSAEIQRIEPRAFPSIERVPVAGGNEVIVVTTQPGHARPYVYKSPMRPGRSGGSGAIGTRWAPRSAARRCLGT